MKYYYKTPEEVQKEIEERKKELKKVSWNKSTVIIFLNLLFLGMIFIILDYTGISRQIYYNKDLKIHYELDLEGKNLYLYFQSSKPYTIQDSQFRDYQEQSNIIKLSRIKIQYNENQMFEFIPYFGKVIIDKKNPYIKIELPENFPTNLKQSENIDLYLLLYDTKLIKILPGKN